MKQLVTYIIIFITPFCAKAQSRLSLTDAVNTGLKNSLDIQLAKDSLKVNTIYNDYGIAGGLPTIAGSASDNVQYFNVNQKVNTGEVIDRTGASNNTLAAGVNGSILLYNGQRVIATKHELEALQSQSQEALNSRIQNVMSNVMLGYYDIIRQQSYMKTIDQSIAVAQQKLTIVKAQQSVGLANNADLFQSQLDLNALLQTQQSQQLVIDQSKTELLRLLTLNPDSVIIITDTIIVDKSITLDTILNAITKNPDVISADDQIKINQFIVKETAAQRYPSIKALAGYNINRTNATAGQLLLNQNYGPSVGLTLAIPIYNGSIYKRQQKAAEINVDNAEFQKQALIRDYNATIVKTYQTYTTTLKQLEAEQENYKLAQQLLNLILQKFQLKQATIVDVKNAQQTFENSGYTLVNLNYAAKAAEITLKRIAYQLTL